MGLKAPWPQHIPTNIQAAIDTINNNPMATINANQANMTAQVDELYRLIRLLPMQLANSFMSDIAPLALPLVVNVPPPGAILPVTTCNIRNMNAHTINTVLNAYNIIALSNQGILV